LILRRRILMRCGLYWPFPAHIPLASQAWDTKSSGPPLPNAMTSTFDVCLPIKAIRYRDAATSSVCP
jgi:hypothetical protein